ncbi:MAG: adenosine deaminase [Chloroflexi bacterium]|nr:adenosine deaminase [Chloroflexota bacterium]
MAFEVTDAIQRDSDIWRGLKAMPKIELHRHLEGSIRLPTLVEVAQQYDIPLPTYDVDVLRPYVQVTREDAPTHQQFLSKFSILRQFFVAEDVIRRVAREVVEDAAADNVRYMELRFTPIALAKCMGFPLVDVMTWVNETVSETAAQLGIKVNLIVAVNRHESVELAEQMMRLAVDFLGRGITAVDLCGNEAGHPANAFTRLFLEAHQAGLGVTIHAGEWAGPENVIYAIQHIKASRIGHGVRSVEDSVALQLARDYGVYFEVCPTSNLQTGVVASVSQHPLIDLRFLDVKLTLNTDDPTVNNTTLTDEYALAVQGLHFPIEYLQQCILNAIQGAFLTPSEKAALEAEFRTAFGGQVL